MTTRLRPVALIILDGWGLSPVREGNAVALARTPTFDRLMAEYPSATLRTSGLDVGLPEGQMGNSEVGHLNLGAGFVVRQDLVRIGEAIEDGSFFANSALLAAVEHARARRSALHLVGLVGDGGVHAQDRHLEALLELARREGLSRVFVHAFTDGRDTAPDSAAGFAGALEAAMARLGVGRIATVTGRYWAMDRDTRWDRTKRAWDALVLGEGARAPSAVAALRQAHAEGVTDEFVPPTVLAGPDDRPVATIGDGDAVVLFNFRADRMRQLLAALTAPDFVGFPRRLPADLSVTTFTEYVRAQPVPAVFPPEDVAWPLARVLAERGLRQLHTAETEKYAHVTYFFNGGREVPFEGEERRLVASPHVATYDLQPEMSAAELTDGLVARIREGVDDFIVVNYANPDMVGHTGDLSAAIRAVETVDACLGRVLDVVLEAGGAALVTADHGNCETMIDPVTGGPHTAHTMNPVPFLAVAEAFAREAPGRPEVQDGRLADVAPTILALMGIPAPPSMTGRVLVGPAPTGPPAGPGGGDG